MTLQRSLTFVLLAFAAFAAAPAAMAQERTQANDTNRSVLKPRAVIELFTSQGCSSCPPADRNLSDLAREPDVIALSLHIDYWDYLGWRDTLGSAANTARQKGYAKTRGDRQVYTPQMVLNGSRQMMGGDRGQIDTVLGETRRGGQRLPVAVTITPGTSGIAVSIGAGEAPGGADIWLCAVASRVPVEIVRGENRGRTMTYANVARRWVKAGQWTGEAVTFHVPLQDAATDDTDAWVVLVQQNVGDKPAGILGAAMVAAR
jgi:hypothetical protein